MEDERETPEAAYRRGYQAGYAAALEIADAEKAAAWVFWEGLLTDWTLKDTDREILPPEFTTEGENDHEQA